MADSKFTIEIETEAKTKQVEELTKKIAELEKKLQTTKKETSDFEGQLRHLETSLAQIGGKTRIASEGIFQFFNSLRGFENLSEVFGSLAASGFIPLIAGATALVGALEGARESLAAFMKVEQAMVGVDAALAQKGMLSGEMRERIQGLAEELRNTTNIAASQWLPVLSRLIQFGADESNIDKYSDAVKNLAGIMGGDIEQAAHLFTRVMQGNVEMLHRYGIRVAEGATTTETLNNAMAEIARVGAGQLEARADTLSGTMRGLKTSIEEVFERVGSGISSTGVFQAVIQGATDSVQYWRDRLSLTIPEMEKLTNAVGAHAAKVNDAKESWTAFEKAKKETQDLLAQSIKDSDESIAFAIEELALKKQLAAAERDLLKTQIDRMEYSRAISKEEAARLKGQIDLEGKIDEANTTQEQARLKRDKARRDADAKGFYAHGIGDQLAQAQAALDAPEMSEGAERRAKTAEQIRKDEQQVKSNQAEIRRAQSMGGALATTISPLTIPITQAKIKRLEEDNKRLLEEIPRLRQLLGPEGEQAEARDPKVIQAKKVKDLQAQKDAADKAAADAERERLRREDEYNRKTELNERIKSARVLEQKEKTGKEVQKGAAEDQKREIDEDKAAERESQKDFKERGFNRFKVKGGLSDALDSYHQANMDALAAVATRISEQQRDLEAVTSRVNDQRLS